MSLMCSVVSVYMALFFMEDSSEENPDAETDRDTLVLGDHVKLLMFVVIVLFNIYFIALLASATYSEVSKQFKKEFPKMYISLCMCGNVKKFDKELEKMSYKQRQDDMVENIDNLIEYLNFVKKQYTDGFIPNED